MTGNTTHSPMAGDNLVIESDGPVGFIRLNRTEKHNAISMEMWRCLPKAIAQLEAASCRIIGLTGTNHFFSAGADLDDLKAISTINDAQKFWQTIKDCLDFVECCSLPIVAIVDGPCVGGGLLLSIACDIRLASYQSSFRLPAAKLGILLDSASVRRLVQLVGKGRAADLLYSGDTISGEQAWQTGLVNRLWQRENLAQESQNFLASLSQNSLASIKHSKLLLNTVIETENIHDSLEDKINEAYLSADFKKRLASVE